MGELINHTYYKGLIQQSVNNTVWLAMRKHFSKAFFALSSISLVEILATIQSPGELKLLSWELQFSTLLYN